MAVSQQQATKEECIIETQSLTLVKNLIRTAVSAIAYLRNLFPENCFADRTISGVTVKALKPEDIEAKLLMAWLEKGVFDAIKRKYLESLMFAIYQKSPEGKEEMLECYNFHIKYPADDSTLSGVGLDVTGNGKDAGTYHSKDEIKKSTVRMIRSLLLLAQTLSDIPHERFLTLKLLYRDHCTPVDYEPQFFRDAGKKDKLLFSKRPLRLKVGEVKTPFHEMSMHLKTVSEKYPDPASDSDRPAYSPETSIATSLDYNQERQTSEEPGLEALLPPSVAEDDEMEATAITQDDDSENTAYERLVQVMARCPYPVAPLLSPNQRKPNSNFTRSIQEQNLVRFLNKQMPGISKSLLSDLLQRYHREYPQKSPTKTAYRASAGSDPDDLRLRITKMKLGSPQVQENQENSQKAKQLDDDDDEDFQSSQQSQSEAENSWMQKEYEGFKSYVLKTGHTNKSMMKAGIEDELAKGQAQIKERELSKKKRKASTIEKPMKNIQYATKSPANGTPRRSSRNRRSYQLRAQK